MARGGFQVDLAWKEGRLTEARVVSLLGKSCRLRYGDLESLHETSKGQELLMDRHLNEL
jgi:alpha-L-fucosidase 2